MTPPFIEVVDWTIDGAVLVVSLLAAKRVLGLTARETAVVVGCCGFYALHEAWEAGLVAPGTHRAAEWWIHDAILGVAA